MDISLIARTLRHVQLTYTRRQAREAAHRINFLIHNPEANPLRQFLEEKGLFGASEGDGQNGQGCRSLVP